MKTWRRLLSALLALVLLLSPVTMLPMETEAASTPAAKSASSDHTLYVFDMQTFLKGKAARHVPYDYLKFATALQGIVNRERPQLFFNSLESGPNTNAGIDIDEVWLEYITDANNGSNMLQNGEDLSKYNIEYIDGTMENFWAIVAHFRSYVNGIVLWDDEVPATANVASTIAGVENLLPVRYVTARDDLYTQLMSGQGGRWTVKRTLVDLFDGETMPTFDSSVPGKERTVDSKVESTRSIKTDPYIWAMEHYLKTGKTNANLMTYSIDARSDTYTTIDPDHPVDSEIVASNVPSAMQAGEIVPVQITVKNTGGIDWEKTNAETWPNPVRWSKVDETEYSWSSIKNGNGGTWQGWLDYHETHFQLLASTKMLDPSETGGLEGIPANPHGGKASRIDIKNRVAQGEEYTFSFYLKAPTQPGSYELAMRLLQDKANANFPASSVIGAVYYVGIEVTEEPVENRAVQLHEAEDSVDYLCAYDKILHTDNNKGAYDVTKDLGALQAHMVYPHEGTVKVVATNTGDAEWSTESGYALRYIGNDMQWKSMDLGDEVIGKGESIVFEIPVSAADVAEDGKSAENVLKAGDQIVVTAQMTKNDVMFGETFTKTVEVKPSFAGKLIAQTVPEMIMAGAKQKVSFTFRNTGSFAWSGSKLDTVTTGLRVAITPGNRYMSATGTGDDYEPTHGYNREMRSDVVVKPGETYTFHVDMHTYPNPLSVYTVATESKASNAASGLNFILNTQGDLAGNQHFSDGYKYMFADHLEKETPLNEVVINEENSNGNDLQITAENIPDEMTVDEVFDLALTLKNAGANTIDAFEVAVFDEHFEISGETAAENAAIAAGASTELDLSLCAPSDPGVYVLRLAMIADGETFRTGYEKIIRVIEADTERESDDGSKIYLDAGYRPALPQEILHTDADDVNMSGSDMAARLLSVRMPQVMRKGESAPVSITVMNVGKKPWNRFIHNAEDMETNARLDVMSSGDEAFRITKDQAGTEGWVGDQNVVEMDDDFDVWPGSSTTFAGWLQAPETAGVYMMRTQMSNAFGCWAFGEELRFPIIVGMNAELTYVTQLEAVNNLDHVVTTLVKNTGEETWTPLADPETDVGYVLKYTFGEETVYASMPDSIAPGRAAFAEFKFDKIYKAGTYEMMAEVIYRTEEGEEYRIGDPITTPLVIDEGVQNEKTLATEAELAIKDTQYGVQIVSTKMPAVMKPGQRLPVTITLKNTGKDDLISKYGHANGSSDGVRVYFGGQGFDPTYKEDIWKNDPTAFDTVNTTDYKLALEKKFFIYNAQGDTRTTSRYGVTIYDRGNNECNCLDLKDGTVLASGDTYTLKGWIVAPYTEGNYEFKIYAAADVNRQIQSKSYTVNISVNADGKGNLETEEEGTFVSSRATYGKIGLFNTALPNADYYISNKAFFFDLSPDATIAPMDDRTQPVGTDTATLRKLFHAQMEQAQSRRSSGILDVQGTGIFTIGGFYPWAYKYSYDVDKESAMEPFHGEFHMIDIASEYGGQTDADAFGTIGLSNASVYQHIEVNLSGSKAVQTQSTFNPNTYCTEKYDPNKNYIMFYMGDYDGGSWVGNLLYAIYNEKDENGDITRGGVPMAWQINTNLADRIPHVYNMLYRNATKDDFFVVGNNGTGYFNVGWALNPRDESITAKQTAQIREDWIAYNQSENREFSLGIQGFIQPTTSGVITDEVKDVYRQTTPYGVADARGVYIGKKKLHHGIYDAQAADGGTPFLYNVQVTRLDNPDNYEASRNSVVGSIHNAMINNDGMVSASSVKWLPSQLKEIVDYYNRVYPNEKLTVVDPYTYFRLYRQKMAAEGGAGMIEYPEINLAARNVSFGESLRLTLAFTFKDIDISKVNMKQDSGIVVWREASEASQINMSRNNILYGETIRGMQLMPGTNNVYVAQTNPIIAKDVDEYLYIRAWVTSGGVQYFSDIVTYSPKRYATTVGQSSSKEMSDLAVAMLNYSAEAQTYAGEVRNADSTLTAAQKKLNFNASSIRQPSAINPAKTTTDTAGYFTKSYQNIRMNDTFNLLFFWQMDPDVYASATDSGVLVWNEAQYNALTAAPSVSNAGTKLSMSSTTINGATCYGAEYSGVAARNIDQTVYTCAYVTINGTTYYSNLVNYSIHRYAQNMISRGGNIATLAKRVIVYGEAAKAYYESK